MKKIFLALYIFFCIVKAVHKNTILESTLGQTAKEITISLDDACRINEKNLQLQTNQRYKLNLIGIDVVGRYLHMPSFFNATAVEMIETERAFYYLPTLEELLKQYETSSNIISVHFVAAVAGSYNIFCRGANSIESVANWTIQSSQVSYDSVEYNSSIQADLANIRNDRRANVGNEVWNFLTESDLKLFSSPLETIPNNFELNAGVPYRLSISLQDTISFPLDFNLTALWINSIFLKVSESFSSFRGPFIESVKLKPGFANRFEIFFIATQNIDIKEYPIQLNYQNDSNISNRVIVSNFPDNTPTTPPLTEALCDPLSREGNHCGVGQPICCPTNTECCLDKKGVARGCGQTNSTQCCENGQSCSLDQDCCGTGCMPKGALCCSLNNEFWHCHDIGQCGNERLTCSASKIAFIFFSFILMLLLNI